MTRLEQVVRHIVSSLLFRAIHAECATNGANPL